MNALIITGGSVEISFSAAFLKAADYDIIIAADKGIEALSVLKIRPDYIVGDFDSANDKILEKYSEDKRITIIKHNPIKDATDTELAIDIAIKKKADRIDILGATGSRIDHLLGNIHCMYKALVNGAVCVIWDKNNRIELVDKPFIIEKDKMFGRFVSFVPFMSDVKGLCLKGFKYNLENFTLKGGASLGISNEVVEDRACVDFKSGVMIYFQTRD